MCIYIYAYVFVAIVLSNDLLTKKKRSLMRFSVPVHIDRWDQTRQGHRLWVVALPSLSARNAGKRSSNCLLTSTLSSLLSASTMSHQAVIIIIGVMLSFPLHRLIVYSRRHLSLLLLAFSCFI